MMLHFPLTSATETHTTSDGDICQNIMFCLLDYVCCGNAHNARTFKAILYQHFPGKAYLVWYTIVHHRVGSLCVRFASSRFILTTSITL